MIVILYLLISSLFLINNVNSDDNNNNNNNTIVKNKCLDDSYCLPIIIFIFSIFTILIIGYLITFFTTRCYNKKIENNKKKEEVEVQYNIYYEI